VRMMTPAQRMNTIETAFSGFVDSLLRLWLAPSLVRFWAKDLL
jgi:hypothetical protein